MTKTVVKNKPTGYGSSQGGIYGVVGYDPLNMGVSLPMSTQKTTGNMNGKGLGADILSGVVGTAGGILAGTYSGLNPYAVSAGSTIGSALGKSIGEMIGLGIIPQKFIDFVDRLISNGQTRTQIKNAIMKFELSPELKAKLSKAVSSLLNSMSGSGMKKMKGGMIKTKVVRKKRMVGSGGIFQPNVSAYGLAKF